MSISLNWLSIGLVWDQSTFILNKHNILPYLNKPTCTRSYKYRFLYILASKSNKTNKQNARTMHLRTTGQNTKYTIIYLSTYLTPIKNQSYYYLAVNSKIPFMSNTTESRRVDHTFPHFNHTHDHTAWNAVTNWLTHNANVLS